MEAFAQAERLISGFRAGDRNPEALDELELLCRAYMVPRLETEWDKYGLTKKECRVMDCLMARIGQVVTFGPIMDAVYFDSPEAAHDSILKVFISHIRKKMKASNYIIETIWGQGYRLNKMTGTESN